MDDNGNISLNNVKALCFGLSDEQKSVLYTKYNEVKFIEYVSFEDMLKKNDLTFSGVHDFINQNDISVLFSSGKVYNLVSKIAWENEKIRKVYVFDASPEFPVENNNERTIKKLWNMVAVRSKKSQGNNTIEQAGWVSLLTGNAFSKAEMDEYVSNTYTKILPYCNSETTILEIGVGSGLICESLCKYVKQYIGTDISDKTIEITEERMSAKGISNINFYHAGAMNIDTLDIPPVNVVILNGVTQYFPGYNYFLAVTGKIMDKMAETGIIFFGDVMNMDMMQEWVTELKTVNKTINENEFWFSDSFFYNIQAYIPGISEVEISKKHGKIQNELLKYRRDVKLTINKKDYQTKYKEKVFEEA